MCGTRLWGGIELVRWWQPSHLIDAKWHQPKNVLRTAEKCNPRYLSFNARRSFEQTKPFDLRWKERNRWKKLAAAKTEIWLTCTICIVCACWADFGIFSQSHCLFCGHMRLLLIYFRLDFDFKWWLFEANRTSSAGEKSAESSGSSFDSEFELCYLLFH